MKRILILATMVAAIMLGGYSCVIFSTGPSVNKMALAHMTQKYGEKFEYAGPWGNSMSGTREFLTKCESFPDQYVFAQIENFRSEKRVFRDNYIAVKYRDETVEFFRKCVAEIFGETNIFYDVNTDGLPTDMPVGATFDEFFTDDRLLFIVMAEVKGSSFTSREQAEEAAKLIGDASGAEFHLTIVIVEDDVYGTFDDRTLQKQVSMQKAVDCASIKIQGGEIKRIGW